MAYRGKVALITGAGSGMGQLACRNFAQSGARVAALDVNELGLAITAEGLDQISTHVVDITDFGLLKNVVAEVEDNIGPIDRVYNCAAIMPLGKVLEQDVEIQHKLMSINWGGLVNIAQATLPRMIARGHGDFVSFASMAGLIPTLLTGAYSATKAAVVLYNENLYHENLNSGIRFASVCPPAVATPMLEQGRDTWPKMIDAEGETLQPRAVLDAIEDALEKGEFQVFARKREKYGALFRRLFPAPIWKHVHKIEGW